MTADRERALLERLAAAQADPPEKELLDTLRAQQSRRRLEAARRGTARWQAENPFPRGWSLFKASRHDRWIRRSQAAGDAAAEQAKADYSRELQAAHGETAEDLFTRLATAVHAANSRAEREIAAVVRGLYTEHDWAVRKIVDELGLPEETVREHVGLPPRYPPPRRGGPRRSAGSSGVDYSAGYDAGDGGGCDSGGGGGGD
ncbi:hypothetical protein ACFPM7_06030 [Actinokineospora guangxiensis]|uniref:Uncharacterized protein n=1 Tax=Actinokineospora guangxiensis TaxID=1490288 RepID=A0ABW0EJW9_9PSEU